MINDIMKIDRQRCIEAGMTFLSKPFVRDDLFKLLDSLLNINTPTNNDNNNTLSSSSPQHGGISSHGSLLDSALPTPATSPMTSTASLLTITSTGPSQASSSAPSSTSSITRAL
jgi:hypothetical protein